MCAQWEIPLDEVRLWVLAYDLQARRAEFTELRNPTVNDGPPICRCVPT